MSVEQYNEIYEAALKEKAAADILDAMRMLGRPSKPKHAPLKLSANQLEKIERFKKFTSLRMQRKQG